MRPGAGCHPRSSSLTLVEAVAGERVGDGDGDGEAGGGTEEKTEEEDDVRWEPALSLQAGQNGTYRRGGYTIPCIWARRRARRTKWRQPGRVRIVMARIRLYEL